MASEFDKPQPAALIGRIKRLLLTPKPEWAAIDTEPMTTASIYRNWVLILAAIGPIAGLLGSQLFGHGLFGITYRPPLGMALTTAISGYVMALLGVYVMALIFNWLAPNFGGTSNSISALKLAAFSATAAWLAGIFQLLPGLGWLGILGLYSFYLLYVGGPLLMRIPTEKAMSYTIVTVIASLVVFLVVGAIANRVGAVVSPKTAASGRVSGTVNIPGVGAIDLEKVQQAGEQMQQAVQPTQGGNANVIAPDRLQAMLPEALGAWKRTEISSSGGGVAGLGGSKADARYAHDGQSFKLAVTDMAAMGGLAALASAANVQSSRQTETSYERTATIDGRLTTEEWDNSRNRGKFSVLIANRFLVEASGQAPSIDALKQAVNAVGIGKLEKMAKAS